jgi:hypothetical protein
VRRLLLAAAVLATAATAEEFDGVTADTLLPDAQFFRLATCGAPPGKACTGPVVRWPKTVVTLVLLPGDTRPPAGFTRKLEAALSRAIDQINGTQAGIRIRRVPGGKADIRVIPTAHAEGEVLTDTPDLYAAGIMGVGYMTYWWNEADAITAATILISTSITDEDLPSVMLEETFQSLGPRFDIEGPAYEGVSILSQTSNATVTIEGQDARLLRWLYP